MKNKKYEAVIFDLDGTLLDTLDDLAAAVNHALGELGFPLRSRDEVRQFVGNGVAKLMERALPAGANPARSKTPTAIMDAKRFFPIFPLLPSAAVKIGRGGASAPPLPMSYSF